MYPIYFFICLGASLTLVISLVLLAVYPIKLPLVEAAKLNLKPKIKKARSPTRKKVVTSYWDDWDSDEDDL